MIVTFLRHARRDYGIGDAPLNSAGSQQATALAQLPELQNVDAIYSSPKQRALQTVEPLARRQKLVPQILRELDQMGSREPESLFLERVEQFLEELKHREHFQHLLICTHSDWLNLAISLLSQEHLSIQPSFFECGQFQSFQLEQGLWEAR